MKLNRILTAALCCGSLLFGFTEQEKAICPGGINSVDFFQQFNARAEKQKQNASENLMPRSAAYWNFGFGANRGSVVGSWNADWAKKEASMAKLVKHQKIQDAKKKKVTFVLETPESINQFRTPRGEPIMHHRLMPVEPLEVKPDTGYCFTYPLKGTLASGSANGFFVTVDFMDENSKYCARSEYFGATPTLAWKDFTIQFRTPAKCQYIRLHFGLKNIGKVEFGAGTLTENKNITSYDVFLYPMGALDNTYCVSRGQVNYIGFSQRIENGKKPAKPQLELTLPKGFKVLSGTDWGKLDGAPRLNADGSTSTLINVREYYWEKYAIKDFSAIFPAQFAITTDLPASDKEYTFTYCAVAGTYRSPVHTAKLRVIPAITGEQPKIFKTGIYDSRMTKADQPVFAQFAKEYRNMGFNVFFNFDCAKYYTDLMRGEKIECWGGSSCINNGYSTNIRPEKRPAYTHFIGVDGKATFDYNGRTPLLCPSTVIYRTDYYKNVILQEVERKMQDRDYLMSNWEPGSAQTSAGCFCQNCKKDFIAYTHLPAAEVNAAWPQNIMGKYRNQWLDFKSHQHGLYLSTYEKDIEAIAAKLGKKDAGFMPMITRDIVLDSEFNLTDVNAFAVRFYASKIKWINPWGPYLAHHWRDLQRDLPGSRIRMLTMARSANRFLDKVIKKGERRPKLLAFPNGLCVGMVVTPEQLAMDTLSVYVGGWQGSTPYYFPCNYDARYWKALADANTAIARTEDIVMKGKPYAGISATLLTPFPAPAYAELNNPSKPISSLQAVGYANGDKLCVALGNFWEYGEAFFKLSIPGLPANKYYQVTEVMTGVSFTNAEGRNYTGKELQNGILQQTGAMRWKFLVIKPADKKATGLTLNATEVEKTMAKRQPAILKAEKAERAFVASVAAPVELKSDCSAFTPISNNGVKVTMKEIKKDKKTVERVAAYDSLATGNANDSRTVFVITAGQSTWNLEADKGLLISSWNYKGTELSFGGTKMGLAVDGPWVPAQLFNRAFNLTKVEKCKEGVALEFTRKLNRNDGKLFDRIQITKRLVFSADKVHITSTLFNPYSDTIQFAYRVQHAPGPMQARSNQAPGIAKFPTEKGTLNFKRLNKNYYFCLKNAPVEKVAMNTLFGSAYQFNTNGPVAEITKPEVEFVTNNGKVGLRLQVAPEVDFNGFASWDSPNELTFEPIFNTRDLPVGQRWSMETILEAKSY